MSRIANLLFRLTALTTLILAFQAGGQAQCLSCVQNLNLPTSYTGLVFQTSDSPSTFVTRFSNIVGEYDIRNGVVYSAWCADNPGYEYTRTVLGLWSTYAPPASLASKPWGKVNWVLNNRTGATATDVQNAVWLLLTGMVKAGTSPSAKALELVSLAASHADFVPGEGQVVAVILPSSGLNRQNMIFELPVRIAHIGDLVWQDSNGNGIQDAGEPGVNGVVVRLKNAAGETLATQTTGSKPGSPAGSYLFDVAAPGDYMVDYDVTTIPPGMQATLTLAGDAALDSNLNGTSVHLNRDQSDLTIDFGLRPDSACNASVGDLVWRDLNGNGIQDAGEPGIGGVAVRLLTLGGQEVRTTNTVNGIYQFTNVCPGTYVVSVGDAPAGHTVSPALAGSDAAKDSDGVYSEAFGVSAQVTLAMGSAVDTIDFGFVPPCNGSIGNFVWWDQNRNGLQDQGEPAIGGVTLRLLKDGADTGMVTVSSGSGAYSFTGLCAGNYTVVIDTNPAGYSPAEVNKGDAALDSNGVVSGAGVKADVTLSGNLSADDTIDFGFLGACSGTIGNLVWMDANRNGIQDAGEAGISGVALNLKKPADNSIIASTTTDASGAYSFGALCTNAYVVEAVPPTGYGATATGQGDAAVDSNVNPSRVVLTTDLSSDDTIDFGFVPGFIGDYVWNDVNHDGVQNAGEAGLPGLNVTLRDAGGAVLRTTSTGADGLYGFNAVAAGSYVVCATPGTGWTQSYDLDGLGTPNCAALTLPAGGIRTDVDFGYYQPEDNHGPFVTYTQGGWGSKPAGNNPGMILQRNWSNVFGAAGLTVGGSRFHLTFTSAAAIEAFLPQGGKAGALKASATDPTKSAAGVFAGQVVALAISVAMSDAGVTRSNLGSQTLVSGKLAGQTVGTVLQLCYAALNGDALPEGLTIADLNAIADAINNNYDNGTVDKGYLR